MEEFPPRKGRMGDRVRKDGANVLKILPVITKRSRIVWGYKRTELQRELAAHS